MNPTVTYYPEAGVREALTQFPTPFHLYDESMLRRNCQAIRAAFDPLFPSFTPLYAVKANSNPHLLKIILDEGFGFDCSSFGEAWLAHECKAPGMYTGCYTDAKELDYVIHETDLLLNLDDVSMLGMIDETNIPEFISFRINPNLDTISSGSMSYAGPNGKYGVPIEQAVDAYRSAQQLGAKRFGIHTMPGCGVLEIEHLTHVAQLLLDLAKTLHDELKITAECINLGTLGGIPYHPDSPSLDLAAQAKALRTTFDGFESSTGLQAPRLMIEPGRLVTGTAGWLVSKVQVIKESYKKFIGLDASANDLMRPMMYDAYHYISVLDKNNVTETETVNVVGRIMENTDHFARDRELPPLEIGDTVIMHCTGAHGYVMGYNYNTRPRSAEYLLQTDGSLRCIRRAETLEDIFDTVTPWQS